MIAISKHRFSFTNDSFKIIAVSFFYFLAHQLSFFFPDSAKIVMLVWPAGGVALASFLLLPRRLWTALIIAFFISGVGADIFLAGRSFLLSIGFMIANIVESIGCASLILYFSRDFQYFTRLREVLALIAGVLFVNALSSSIAAVVSVLVRGASFGDSWRSWFIADGLGILLIAPLIVVWTSNIKTFISRLSFIKIAEGIMCLIIGSTISWLIFFPISLNLIFDPHPYLILPFLVWPAIRFGQRGITLTLIFTFLIAITSSSILNGPSPWGLMKSTDDFSTRLLELQIFLSFLAVTGYIIAAGYESLMRSEIFLKRSNEQLKSNSHDLNIAQSVAKIGSWKWYIQENRLEWSQGMYSLFGISESSFTGNLEEVIQQSIHPDDKARVDASNNSVSEKGIPVPLDYRIVLPDGTIKIVWAEAGELIKDENSKPFVLSGFVQDITERKQADLALMQSRNLLLNLANLVPGVIYQYRLYPDGSSAFPYSSMGMNDIYEVTPEEVREDATPVFGRLHPEDAERVGTDIFESARTLQTFYCEFRVILPRQGLRWRWSQALPERTPDGGTLWHGIISDITDRKQVELELIKAKEKAEESDRLKSAFLANMSHEIRTPMNSILGFTELLKEPRLTGEQQQNYIEIIEKSGARMLNTVNNIVDMSKIESGLMEVNIKESNINERIQVAYNFFKPEAESKGLKLFFKNGLSTEEASIETDHEKVHAVLINLIKNAIKYTDNGSIAFGYKIKESKDSRDSQPTHFLEFFVKDTGIGIPKDRQEAIFERFVQADLADKRAFQGSGLGLTISKSYVEMLGGKLWVNSEEGRGSTFYFTIPYKAGTEEKTIINVISKRITKVQITKLKILIAEDDEESANLLSMRIKKLSKEILLADNGINAVELCRSNPDIDLILMDIQMPKMDGLEATHQIRQFNKDVIIIAQTAYAFLSDEKKAKEAGCNYYVSKPINYTALLEFINMLFDKKK